MSLQRPKGTQDHLPDGSPKLRADLSASAFSHVTRTAARVLERGGAQWMETPLFEYADLVQRGVGSSTDIVRKEMFTVTYAGEHGGYILRPEGTAGIVRAYLENGLKQLPSPLKLWTHGPMFRAENVQQGRLRQFHQVDYEVIGSALSLVDAEAIWLMVQVVQELGLTGARIKLGSVGDPADRERYDAYLRQLFTPHAERLSADSQDRLTRNPMRILDSKSKDDQALIVELGVEPMLNFLGEEASAHFQEVRGHLEAWGVPYDLDPSIVRGLDYYRRTAWELHHQGVGAKSALGGGGRYDGLAKELGGPETPAVGWAFGIERLLIAMDAEGLKWPLTAGPLVYVAALDAEQVDPAARVALGIRAVARAEFAYRALKPGNVFREAERRTAVYAALIGSEEAGRGSVMLKHLSSGVQREVPVAELNALLLSDLFSEMPSPDSAPTPPALETR
ncbi:histidine--tRNA ligase [Deinococcus psychrotolerans]|uniref:Histidine--tRNA ligase n=1 Tax=Deinococcus psychrotolerans TaxID=2489213 RepID=A0A3G8Y8U5_9DEIO|nr:histidine--tRNA ligase [Deinococcus psychrotolerans]AZI41792.1 histidine--tRNA ligase [Deinococcus psychrotolerans]